MYQKVPITFLCFFAALILVNCQLQNEAQSITSSFDSLPSITGKTEYLQSPYVTAGDRLYMVGHQDGSFPELGWHVDGEMGGIWDHPIKLMDGFVISVRENSSSEIRCLDNAKRFINYPAGNRHIFEHEGLNIERTQFVPDGIEGIIIELSITNESAEDKSLEIDFTGMVDLMPVWLADSLNIQDGLDSAVWQDDQQVFIASDKKNPWFAIFGSNVNVEQSFTGEAPCSGSRKGQGVDATLTANIELGPGTTHTVQYYIAGSSASKEDALNNYNKISSGSQALLEKKTERLDQLKSRSELHIPDKDIQQMYTWMKYNTDWLIRDVEGIGRGVSAGIPDYPWWFAADNAYTLQGLLATGRFEEVYATVDLLFKLSDRVNNNGRIVHEASTNGVVFNKGNMNETPHIIWLLWKIYEWTGDRDFLEKNYSRVQQGIEYLLEEADEDGNLYPNGHGMMEIRGLDTEMIDVAVYTQQALLAAGKIAGRRDNAGDSERYHHLADSLAQKINSEWWVQEFQSYADFRATKQQALGLIDDAIVRADTLKKPWAVKELQSAKRKISDNSSREVEGYVVHHNWVVNTPMEMGIADPAKAELALATARDYTSRFGMYVTGIDRDEAREESNKWEVFSYVGAVMTLPTGVQAVAEANYGNIEESYDYLKMLSNSFSYALPGSMYEVSPDYGMITQAWNIYGVAVPVIEHYFGIKPRANDERIILRPQMPEGWEEASLQKVRVGDNYFSISKQTDGSSTEYRVDQQQPGWEIDFQFPREEAVAFSVNGQAVEPDTINGLFQIRLTGRSNTVTIRSESNL